ncbi:Uma2 family endonuclease [Hyalangium versicolor]|uniref:Uma2 family endonuclease n=1 Tax=Hyalangium versicolor TaxID=2861190 RepID=UPI001CCE9C4F|nr:Uma2 family endonuclease [Hyalangium versicolor]
MSDRPPRRAATFEDLEGVPPHRVGEIVDGELYVSPRPAPRHARATVRLVQTLSPFDRPPGSEGLGGWVLLFEPELHLGRDALVPDVAGWRRERLPEIPEEAAMTLAPDWVCEVLSPSTEALDRARKMTAYAREGVKHLWLVDPRPRMLEVYRLAEGRWLRLGAYEGNATVRAEPFEAIELKLDLLWEH